MMPHHYDHPDPDRQPRPGSRKPGTPRSGLMSDLWLAVALINGMLFAATLNGNFLTWLVIFGALFVNEINGWMTPAARRARAAAASWGTAR